MNLGNAVNPEQLKSRLFWVNNFPLYVKYQSLFRKHENIIRTLGQTVPVSGYIRSVTESPRLNIQVIRDFHFQRMGRKGRGNTSPAHRGSLVEGHHIVCLGLALFPHLPPPS
jgi:hypothetical protein